MNAWEVKPSGKQPSPKQEKQESNSHLKGMQMRSDDVIVPIFLFCAIAAPFIIYLINRHRERMAILEKGVSGEEIRAIYAKDFRRDPLVSLKWGLLLILGGLAILVGRFLHDRYFVEEGVMVGLVPLFVGVGLILFYSIASKKMNQ